MATAKLKATDHLPLTNFDNGNFGSCKEHDETHAQSISSFHRREQVSPRIEMSPKLYFFFTFSTLLLFVFPERCCAKLVNTTIDNADPHIIYGEDSFTWTHGIKTGLQQSLGLKNNITFTITSGATAGYGFNGEYI